MPKKKDGFKGERSVVLSPMVVEMEQKDKLASSLYVTDIGYYPNAENHYRERKESIDQYVLIYCAEGNGFYMLDGKEYQVEKNQFFILPANVPHAYGSQSGSSWTIYWVHFGGEHAAVYAEGMQTPQFINVALNSRIRDRINIFEEIISTLEESTDLECLRYASSVLHHFLASMRFQSLYREAAGRQSDSNPTEAAIHYMKENIENHITLDDVLRYVGYSQSHFYTIFRKSTGMSPLAYFNQLKIEYACMLLRDTNLMVNQICYKVGIEDQFYFSRLFTKTMGMSPSKYREENS